MNTARSTLSCAYTKNGGTSPPGCAIVNDRVMVEGRSAIELARPIGTYSCLFR